MALALTRPDDALVALVGAWRAGFVALPLEPSDPAPRRAAQARAAGVAALVADADGRDDLEELLPAPAGAPPDLGPPAGGEAAVLVPDAPGADLTHAVLVHALAAAAARLGLGPSDVVALAPGATLFERLLPQCAGARAVALSDDDLDGGEEPLGAQALGRSYGLPRREPPPLDPARCCACGRVTHYRRRLVDLAVEQEALQGARSDQGANAH